MHMPSHIFLLMAGHTRENEEVCPEERYLHERCGASICLVCPKLGGLLVVTLLEHGMFIPCMR
jgi:hypothetical protein